MAVHNLIKRLAHRRLRRCPLMPRWVRRCDAEHDARPVHARPPGWEPVRALLRECSKSMCTRAPGRPPMPWRSMFRPMAPRHLTLARQDSRSVTRPIW